MSSKRERNKKRLSERNKERLPLPLLKKLKPNDELKKREFELKPEKLPKLLKLRRRRKPKSKDELKNISSRMDKTSIPKKSARRFRIWDLLPTSRNTLTSEFKKLNLLERNFKPNSRRQRRIWIISKESSDKKRNLFCPNITNDNRKRMPRIMKMQLENTSKPTGRNMDSNSKARIVCRE